nr:uncharacterized protein LOC112757758 [Arachis hypogaea]
MAEEVISPTLPPINEELVAMSATLLAEIRRMADLLEASHNRKSNAEDPKSANGARSLDSGSQEVTPPKERLTIDNPFSEKIVNFQMPKNFVLPTVLKAYERFGDPRLYIKKFQSMMFFNGASDRILCHSFPTYLDGAALLWFSKIPVGSISCFEELARSFIDYFAASRIYVHGSDYVSTIKQGPQESLKDYMTRLTKATMEIPDLDSKVHRALKSGLRPRKFQETIAVNKPKMLEEFQEKAVGQMEIEELREAWRMEKPQFCLDEEKRPRSHTDKKPKKPFKLVPKFDSYTKFNTKREDIIKEILHNKLIKPPSKAGTYQDQRYVDKIKHCAFH